MKKILWFGISLLLLISLLACQQEEEASINVVLNDINIKLSDGDTLTSITKSISFPTVSERNKKAIITWNTSHLEIIDAYGTLNQPRDNTDVTISVTISLNGEERTKFFNVTVIGYYQEITITFKVLNAIFKTIKMNKGDVITAFSDPEVEGYIFEGWFISPNLTTAYQFNTPLQASTTIEAKMTLIPVGSYTIEIYFQNIDDDLYTLISTEYKQGYVGDDIDLSNKAFVGFGLDIETSNYLATITTSPLTLKLYYVRHIYTITYYSDGVDIGNEYIRYGENPSFEEPTKTGYTFVGWSLDEEGDEIVGFEDYITTNLTLYAVWIEAGAFTPYYQSLQDVSDDQLLLALRILVNTHKTLISYGDARYILQESDRDPLNPNNVLTIYTRQSVNATWISTNDRLWEREHVWPNSRLGVQRVENTTKNIGTDLHNLRAVQPSINNTKSNYVVGLTTLTQPGLQNNIFFPGHADKGDVARIVLFMYVAYDYLQLTDEVLPVSSPDNYRVEGAKYGMITALLRWHIEDPVDDFERQRNQVIFEYQGNRNPFIDYPEFVERIWGPITLSAQSSINLHVVIEAIIYLSNDIDYQSFKKDIYDA